jgi:hypothetical protein
MIGIQLGQMPRPLILVAILGFGGIALVTDIFRKLGGKPPDRSAQRAGTGPGRFCGTYLFSPEPPVLSRPVRPQGCGQPVRDVAE